MTRAWLSLGSNIEPQRHLPAALGTLHTRFGALAVSPAYRFAALGFEGPDFVNLAVGLDTELEPPELDAWLHALENAQARRRDVPRYSSRTLDVDIVLFGDRVIDGPGHLQIPRAELAHAFVLQPLADIAADVRLPTSGERIADLWRACAEPPGTPVTLPE